MRFFVVVFCFKGGGGGGFILFSFFNCSGCGWVGKGMLLDVVSFGGGNGGWEGLE